MTARYSASFGLDVPTIQNTRISLEHSERPNMGHLVKKSDDAPAITMESDSLALLVPGIWNSAIQYITFKSMVRWVLEANLNQKIERSDMVSLWDAVVYILYYFESSATQEKKAREVCSRSRLRINEWTMTDK